MVEGWVIRVPFFTAQVVPQCAGSVAFGKTPFLKVFADGLSFTPLGAASQLRRRRSIFRRRACLRRRFVPILAPFFSKSLLLKRVIISS
jgi:hypothetical protein